MNDAIRNELNGLKQNTKSLVASQIYDVKPRKITNVLVRLQKKVNEVSNLPAQASLDDLVRKLSRMNPGEKPDFTQVELTNLVLTLPAFTHDKDKIQYILNTIDLDSFRIFKRAMLEYFKLYGKNEATRLLRYKLKQSVNKNPRFVKRLSYLKWNKQLLSEKGDQVFASGIQGSLKYFMDEIGLPVVMRGEKFVKVAIIFYFKNQLTSPENQIDILKEIQQTDLYKEIMPIIASPLIVMAENMYRKQHIDLYKNMLLKLFRREFGDPRYANKGYKWNAVNEEAKRIFLSWLKETDMEIFFELIDKTAVDHMWRYRKDFWSQYLDKMFYTKVFLGDDAKREAEKLKNFEFLDYGKLKSNDSSQSLFVFSINDYTIMEVSHNGRIRAWDIKMGEKYFFHEGNFEVIYPDIIHLPTKYKKAHTNPPSSWQSKVDHWLINYVL